MVGVGVNAVYNGGVVALTALGGLSAVPAALGAFCMAAPLSYAGHRSYTFGSQAEVPPEFRRFVIVAAFALAAALLSMYIMVDLGGLPPIAGGLTATVVVPLGNFIALDRRVFISRREMSSGS
jgi:putative flippase GtrA